MIEVKRSFAVAMLDHQPLSWRPVSLDDTATASFVCSNGHEGVLSDHSIDTFGEVSPSVVCSTEGCGFHDFLSLSGWRAYLDHESVRQSDG